MINLKLYQSFCRKHAPCSKINHSKRAILALLLIVTSHFALAQVSRQEIRLQFTDTPLSQIIASIEKQSQYNFFYNNDIDVTQRASIHVTTRKLDEILNALFQHTPIGYRISEQRIVLFLQDGPKDKGKGYSVSGIVSDAGGPVVGATVATKDGRGTITDINGRFALDNIHNGEMLRISYIGYRTKKVVFKGESKLNIVIEEDATELEQVVVTALGIKRAEKALSYNVQQLTNEDITTVKSANFVSSLAGKVAGVQVNSSAAGPGAAVKVVMRGAKSITLSNNALYVIDGVPMNNYSQGGADGAKSTQPGTESIADINPDDIESMSVLTGPSSAALYGYEGANGVILITTKKGAVDKTSISYSNNTTFSSPLMMPKFQNRYGNNPGESVSWGEATGNGYDPARFFNTGVNSVNTVSLSTGNSKSQSYFSVSANNATGILPNNDYDRYNFTYRNTSTLLKDKLMLDASVNYIIQKNKNMVSQGEYFNPLPALYLFPRGEDFTEVQLFERYDMAKEVNTQYWPYEDQGLSLQNPYWVMNRMDREVNRRRYLFSVSLKYNITDWLNVVGRVNVDNSNFRNTDKRHAGTLATFAGPKGRYRVETRDERQVYADLIASLNKKVGAFAFNLNVGGSFKDRRMESGQIEGDLNKITNWFTAENMNRAVGVLKIDDNGLKQQTQSIFGNLEIGYNNFLYLTLTERVDWDSALAWSMSGLKPFDYPSVGLSGLISEVVDLPDWFTYLKGRVSLTSVANPYAPYLTKSFYIYDAQTDEYQLSKTKPNNNLNPESTTSFEAGLNLKFFDAALSLDATYYKSNTRNQTHLATIADGRYNNVYIQAGNVVNSGLELALGYTKTWNDFSWSSDYTFTYNKNKVSSLVRGSFIDGQEIEMTEVIKTTLGNTGSPILKLTEGGTMGDIYMTSDFQRDNNGYIYLDPTTQLPSMVSWNPSEYKKLGSLLPKYNMGWRNSFSYKGLRLNVLLNARVGGLVVSNTQAILDRYGVSEYSAQLREAGGLKINQIAVSAKDFLNIVGEGTGKADYYVYDATNVRLQEVSLEYTLPRKKLNNLANVTLALIGNNLGMIYSKAPFDPEMVPSASSSFYTGVDYFMQPSLRNLGFSVKLQF